MRDISFSILIGCYGGYPQYSLRAVQSILRRDIDTYKIHIGANICCKETKDKLRELSDEKKIDTLIENNNNINKDPMMRLLIDLVDTKYFIWMDDDSHFLENWQNTIIDFIKNNQEFDCAGHIYFSHKSEEYKSFLVKRPWFVSENSYLEEEHKTISWFATGGLFIGRTDFFRTYNFPDKLMIKKQDDILLGDMISQHHGRLLHFTKEAMDKIKISDGNRRGSGEGVDGWKK